jgi:hypothetical protein
VFFQLNPILIEEEGAAGGLLLLPVSWLASLFGSNLKEEKRVVILLGAIFSSSNL